MMSHFIRSLIPTHTNIDKIDHDILRILQKDSSTPFVNVAEKIGVTDGTIHQRIRKLKKSGVIKRFTVELNNEKVGNDFITYATLTIEPGYIGDVSKEISNHPQIQEIHEVHTMGQLLIKIRASSPEETRNIIVEKLGKIEGITNTELIPVYKTWKEQHNLLF
jgi:Lrp/AsnC family transcriptional regulator for asnA, asnC and gidA